MIVCSTIGLTDNGTIVLLLLVLLLLVIGGQIQAACHSKTITPAMNGQQRARAKLDGTNQSAHQRSCAHSGFGHAAQWPFNVASLGGNVQLEMVRVCTLSLVWLRYSSQQRAQETAVS